jgi:hypothetical protein
VELLDAKPLHGGASLRQQLLQALLGIHTGTHHLQNKIHVRRRELDSAV